MQTELEKQILAAGNQADSRTIRTITASLSGELGNRILYLMCDLASSDSIRDYIRGTKSPRPRVDRTLREAYRCYTALCQTKNTIPTTETVRAWFTLPHPYLDCDSPVQALKEKRFLAAYRAAMDWAIIDSAGIK